MNKYFIYSSLITTLIAISSCSTEQQPTKKELDSNNIQLEKVRAKSKERTVANRELKTQELNLQQYKAITNYTEVVKGKLNTFVELQEAAEIRLSIINVKGVLINTYSEKSKAGVNEFQLDFSDLDLGQYYVTLVSKNLYRRFCVAKTQ